ncbi:TraR/DksA family transcriptional regulator [Kushneria sinocarnis]|uniref:TraR/DksA family transcriptional regulator n=1 Tax=Kushneria sinocarnis TaxID=595502 RepID=A0A420WW17_9GAMM|nr:DksA/TraR family C4-type zinc finger protein [Kushneria sinocarnis]RKR03297.1 TraR/DksA family transcriptional regulator [Kushneria sinocarnis]
MANGWARDGAVQEQIDDTVEDGIRQARSRLGGEGESLSHCELCEAGIPQRRREAIPGVRLCVACQAEEDRRQQQGRGINRRASKDSQLR